MHLNIPWIHIKYNYVPDTNQYPLHKIFNNNNKKLENRIQQYFLKNDYSNKQVDFTPDAGLV